MVHKVRCQGIFRFLYPLLTCMAWSQASVVAARVLAARVMTSSVRPSTMKYLSPARVAGTLRAHLVPSFILRELNIHLKMFKTKILKLNLIHHAFIFLFILVPNLCLGACCRCRACVCRCFCLSP